MALDAALIALRAVAVAGLGVFTVAAVLAVVRSGRTVFAFASASVRPIANASGRFVSVRGCCETGTPLSGPLSGEDCIAYVIEERAIDRDGTAEPTGAALGVVTPFDVVDDTGELSVVPTGDAVEWAGGEAYTLSTDAVDQTLGTESSLTIGPEESPPGELEPFVGMARRRRTESADRYEYRERRLPPGATVTVTGRYAKSGSESRLTTKPPFRLGDGSPKAVARGEFAITAFLSAVAAGSGLLFVYVLRGWLL